MGWLVSDWEHRDPDNELEDVETGLCMAAQKDLSPLTRMMYESTDFHLQLEEDDGGHYHVTKVVRRRNPEFQQGTNKYFILDDEGNRVPLTEEQMDQYLGIEHDPEDVYALSDEQLEAVECEHTAPMDAWDIVWDETEVYRTLKRLEDDENPDEDWESLTDEERSYEEQMMRDGNHPDHNCSEYSAKFFEYPRATRHTSGRARVILKELKEKDLSRAAFARLLGRAPKQDLRPQKARELKAEASQLPLGTERARKMMRAQAMLEGYKRSTEAMKARGQHIENEADLTSQDRRDLWAAWRQEQLERHGKVELTQWQYEKGLFSCLLRKGVDSHEARSRVQAAVKKLFGSDQIGRLTPYEFGKLREEEKPDWLQNAT